MGGEKETYVKGYSHISGSMVKNLVTSVTEIENMEKGMLPKVVLTLQEKINSNSALFIKEKHRAILIYVSQVIS